MENITLEDLLSTCEICAGTGDEPDVPTDGGGTGYTVTKQVFHLSTGGTCASCQGRGFKVTPSGQAIIDFLAKCRAKVPTW